MEKVLCVGPYAADFALRCHLAGFPKEKIVQLETMAGMPEALKGTTGDVYGILNFDMIEPFLDAAE